MTGADTETLVGTGPADPPVAGPEALRGPPWNVLAGGVGYFAFFSIFPALLLAFTIFGFVLQGQPQLLADLRDYVSEFLPGFVQTPDNPEGIITLEPPTSGTVSSVVSIVGLLIAGLGWLGALREGIRAIFGWTASRGTRSRSVARPRGHGRSRRRHRRLGRRGRDRGRRGGWLAGLVGLGSRGWPLTLVAPRRCGPRWSIIA